MQYLNRICNSCDFRLRGMVSGPQKWTINRTKHLENSVDVKSKVAEVNSVRFIKSTDSEALTEETGVEFGWSRLCAFTGLNELEQVDFSFCSSWGEVTSSRLTPVCHCGWVLLPSSEVMLGGGDGCICYMQALLLHLSSQGSSSQNEFLSNYKGKKYVMLLKVGCVICL